MVQFVFTPWRDRQELLTVRGQFYPQPPDTSGDDALRSLGAPELGWADDHDAAAAADQRQARQKLQHRAVARVSMWVQRGNCPHLVESTALLTAAVLSDEELLGGPDHQGSSAYAVRAAYSTAFSRFVTGLMDMQQDKQRKMSMFSIAKTIGLPATFVELRHQATHEQLPSLARLRSAAEKALAWIWEYYWKHLEDQSSTQEPPTDPCYESLAEYLSRVESKDAASLVESEGFQELLRRWGKARVLRTLMVISDKMENGRVLLRCLQALRQLIQADGADGRSSTSRLAELKDMDTVRDEITRAQDQLSTEDARVSDATTRGQTQSTDPETGEDIGWSRYERWEPKPIGVV